eukprot:scaffold7429_cov417-Prasinococcus_capsulatus_cf.AAC.4
MQAPHANRRQLEPMAVDRLYVQGWMSCLRPPFRGFRWRPLPPDCQPGRYDCALANRPPNGRTGPVTYRLYTGIPVPQRAPLAAVSPRLINVCPRARSWSVGPSCKMVLYVTPPGLVLPAPVSSVSVNT